MIKSKFYEADTRNQIEVLLVDRNADMLEMLADLVEDCGYKSIEVSNGSDAAELALTLLPRIVVTSMRLPDCRGDELAHRLRNDPRTSSIMVVLLTGAPTEMLPSGALRDFSHVIQKPFHLEALTKLLAGCHLRACDRRLS